LRVDQGTADQFLDVQLKPELLSEACQRAGVALELRLREGYDHSYFFIASFIEEHLRFHARHLRCREGVLHSEFPSRRHRDIRMRWARRRARDVGPDTAASPLAAVFTPLPALGDVGRNGIHQGRRQAVIGLQAQLLQARPDRRHLRRIGAGLDDGRNKRGELRRRPAAHAESSVCTKSRP
jgi:hypothetical protein